MKAIKWSVAAALAACLGVAAPLAAHAAGNTDLASIPLSEASGDSVPPNIFFVLDDSNSMNWDHMPDYTSFRPGQDVTSKACPGSGSLKTNYTDWTACKVGDPPFSANGFNTVYYNPATRYRPPKNADGTEWPNASKTTPLRDPFLLTGTNIVPAAPQAEYCKQFFNVDGSGKLVSPSEVTKALDLSCYPDAAWCQSGRYPTGDAATDSYCSYYPTYDPSNPAGTEITDYPRFAVNPRITRRVFANPYPVYYTLTGSYLWCQSIYISASNSYILDNCISSYQEDHPYPMWTPQAEITGTRATRSFYVVQAGGTGGPKTKSISILGNDIATFTVNYPSNTKANRIDLANKIIAAINGAPGWFAELLQNDTSAHATTYLSGNNCRSSNLAYCARIRVTAPGGPTSLENHIYNKTLYVGDNEPVDGIMMSSSFGLMSGGRDWQPASAGATFRRFEIKPGQTYTKHPGRSDCAGSECSYDEELQNFANWYAYYRTRLMMMKTAASRAFVTLDDHYRVGFSVISDTTVTNNVGKFLGIKAFNATQKQDWYNTLFQTAASGNTPLLGALSKAGRYYAGVLTGIDTPSDPMTLSCQHNYTILTTDGGWNDSNPKDLTGGVVGDRDGGASVSRPSRDDLAIGNTLADVAYYYYHTDLRTSGAKAANDVPRVGTNAATDDVATHQHMTTFTLGLGVNGALRYVANYKEDPSPTNDYNNILQGTLSWPNPYDNNIKSTARIDDLWHAAVNGRGAYYSAKNPDSLAQSLQKMLETISLSEGSGAAAATSNLEPVQGDNYIFVGSYRTQIWDGNLAGHVINLADGTIQQENLWSAGDLLNARIAADGNSDGRTIYTFEASNANKLKPFTWASLSAVEKGYFDNLQLSQYAGWSPAIQAQATGERLVNYLRGQNRYEDQDRPGDFGTYYRLYRDRENVLGDLVHSQPVYVKKPPFGYGDDGYSAFKVAQDARTGVVYVAANDGMLHAFNSATGAEMWAYVTRASLREMWRLADRNYASQHRFFIDASPVVADVKTALGWKTILVGGYGAGARGYYALDVTNPATPVALWNFDQSNDPDMGYSFGNAIVTKLEGSDQWVVVLPSGYNNNSTDGGDGEGHIWVLDALTGSLVRKIDTDSGSTGSPSGLAYINNWVQAANQNNSTTHVYGGDLDGKLWKFDIVAGTKSMLANFGSDQPITVPIEFGLVEGKRVLFFGTGRYLGQTDIPRTETQSIYAIKDPVTNPNSPRANLVKQELAAIDDGTRTINNPQQVDWAGKDGWYIDLPDTKERVTLPAILQLGTLIVASNVPSVTECSPGGYSWMYQLDAKSGSFVKTGTNSAAGWKHKNITVGFNVVRLPNGKVIIYRTAHNNPVPQAVEALVSQGSAGGVRINWREIVE